MPSVTFSDYASTSWGPLWSDVEIDYIETYNMATNVTRVSISGVYFRTRGDTNFGTQVIRGRVKINGETVCSFSPGSSTATQINVSGSYTKLDNGSGSFYADVAHAADGTGSFTIAVDEAEDASISSVFGFWYSPLSHKIGVWGNDVGPQTITLTTRPRISSISATNANFGSAVSLSISRYNSSFTHTVRATCAGRTETVATKTSSTSLSWTPAVANFAPLITNAMSATATITCDTYNGNNLIGSSTTTCTLTFRAADVAPAVSIATTDPQGYLSTYGRYVKSKSKIKVTLTNTLRYGATLSLTQITANGATYNSSPATTAVIASTSNTSVTARITDSRGQTATASVTIAIYDYTQPQINSFSVHRCNSDGTLNNSGAYMRVDYKVTVTALGTHNSKTLTLKYKKVSASSYTSQAISLSSYTQTGEVHNITADVNSSYNVQLVLSDDFTSETSGLTLPTASTRMNWKAGENGGIAFGKVCEYDKTFEIADDWDLRYNNYIPLNKVVNNIPANADLNDYNLPGVYAISYDDTVATIANIPSQFAGTLRVFAGTGAEITASSTWKYLIQEYIAYTGARYQRDGRSGSGTAVTWGAWKTIYTSADFKSGNGYCKMPDGTLICYGTVMMPSSGTVSISFASSFVNEAYGFSATYETLNGNVPGAIGTIKAFSIYPSSITVTIAGEMPSAFVDRLRVSYVAIGRWK